MSISFPECFKKLKIFVPEVLMSAAAMDAGVEVLRPHLQGQDVHSPGTVVIGSRKGDVHDIGKNLVVIMLEGTGFKVIDLGVDVKTDQFVAAVKEHKPAIVGMSALLTTTMNEFKNNVEAFKEAGVRDEIKIMVGGAPVNKEFAMEAGADFYGENAMEAVDKAKEYVSE